MSTSVTDEPATPTPSPVQPVRFAVIGCGSLAQGTHLPNLVRSRQADLHTCCDVTEDVLAVCRTRFAPQRTTSNWREAVADPAVDAVCLATTEKLRLPVIEACAAAGKPVYVEKPLARHLDEALAIQRVVHEAKISLCVGHNRRSSPAMLDARRIFRAHMDDPKPCPWRWDREGAARPALPEDRVPAMNVRINDDWWSWKRWVFDREHAPHGPMLFEMTHFTDMCNWFLADEPVEVVAVESGMLNHAVIVRYRGGAVATLTMGANGSFGYPKELYELMGGGAVVAVDHMVELRTAGIAGAPRRQAYPLENDPYPQIGTEGGLSGWMAKRAQACADAAERGTVEPMLHGNPDKGHARQLDRFIDEIRGTGEQVCGVDDAILATRVAFAAIRSAAEHRPVAMDEIQQLPAGG